jgi:hypothetical protein
MQDTIDLHRPPSDLQFPLPQRVLAGPERKCFESLFWGAIFDKRDNDASVTRNVEMLPSGAHIADGSDLSYRPSFTNSSGGLLSEPPEGEGPLAL